jgi:hypothetical protein
MLEGSDFDTELDKKNRFGAVPIYPKQYESDSAILENDSDYATDIQNRKTFEEINIEEKIARIVRDFKPS